MFVAQTLMDTLGQFGTQGRRSLDYSPARSEHSF